MKIYNKINFAYPKLNFKKNIAPKTVKENKSFDTSSLDALENIKRADLDILFKENKARIPQNLSAEAFENYAKEIDEKISKIENEKSRTTLKDCLTGMQERRDFSLFILDRVASNECLYNNPEFISEFAHYFLHNFSVLKTVYSLEEVRKMVKVADKILSDKGFYENHLLMQNMTDIMISAKSNNGNGMIRILNKISKEELYKDEKLKPFMVDIIKIAGHKSDFAVAEAILDKKLYNDKEKYIRAEKLLAYPKLRARRISEMLRNDKFYDLKKETFNALIQIIKSCYTYNDLNHKVLDEFLCHEEFYTNPLFIEAVYNEEDCFEAQDEEELESKIRLARRLFSSKEIIKNSEVLDLVARLIKETISVEDADKNINFIDKITDNKNLCYNSHSLYNALLLACSTGYIDSQAQKILDKILNTQRFISDDNFMDYAPNILWDLEEDEYERVLSLMDDENIAPVQIPLIAKVYVYSDVGLEYDDAVKLNQTIGLENASKLSIDDTDFAFSFLDFYKKEDISELSSSQKIEFIRRLVSKNSDLFMLSSELKEIFPLLPLNQEEYCALLPKLVKTIGVRTNSLTDAQIEEFYPSIINLSNELSKLSDEEFNNLKINQKYSKDDFICDVTDKIKDLSVNEKQRIFDYFGFEIVPNDRTKAGYSMTGYPFLNNEKPKNAEIKQNIERIKDNVDKFLSENPIECNNKEIENELNKIISALPELRTLINKVQSGNIDAEGNKIGTGSHDYDIFMHSLKVMQKITQNPDFMNLNDSDKKVILLASLLHDITKKEGYSDKLHPDQGSFDAYYISKKFNLTSDEEYKLYTLIKTHEWLAKVNSSKNEEELNKNLKYAAYDLRYDNLFDMSLIFTHADLMAVRKDNSFHNKKYGAGRTNFRGEIRSFGESADYYGNKIKYLINELKKTQPILPVTKIPSASRINQEIKIVNHDGSTNLKGIYKDKDGLIVIKYNEVENETWGKIGFPKDSVSSGIKSQVSAYEKVNTGNIKFFVHGLDDAGQLINFDRFSLIDSDALISVSYAERPELKYRFFRPQGVILNSPTKFIHGGGDSDCGSGIKKTLQTFKDAYIFDGERYPDRLYISELIKKAVKMTSEEYIEFVKENENKSFSEIEPEELRNKIITAFASINSNARFGNREYNEMYISNPMPPMAVYAYSYIQNKKISNPIDFLNRDFLTPQELACGAEIPVYNRTEFLRKYALERDIPFFVFSE